MRPPLAHKPSPALERHSGPLFTHQFSLFRIFLLSFLAHGSPGPSLVRPISLTWLGHALANSNGVFPLPLLQLLLHLINLGWIEGPQAALARGTSRFVLHLLEALVEG